MKKLVVAFAVMAALACAWMWLGCSDDPCSGLADMCSSCTDATAKTACEAAAKIVVDAANSDACKAWKDAWDGTYKALYKC